MRIILGFTKIHRAFEKKPSLPSTSVPLPTQALVSVVNSFHEKIVALEGKASELERTGNGASKATMSRSMTAVWQRWNRLRAVAQDQEKIDHSIHHPYKLPCGEKPNGLKDVKINLPPDHISQGELYFNWCDRHILLLKDSPVLRHW